MNTSVDDINDIQPLHDPPDQGQVYLSRALTNNVNGLQVNAANVRQFQVSKCQVYRIPSFVMFPSCREGGG